MNTILTILLLMIILGLIITIHEFGHFIAAKKSGVYVEEFSIGMGPLLFKRKPKNSETTYSLRLLPIGGYVAMAEREDKESKIKKDRVLENKGFFHIFWVLINGIAFNFLLAIIVCFISGCIYGRPISDTVVRKVDESYPAYDSGLEVGDTVVSVNGVKVDSSYDFAIEVNGKKQTTDQYVLSVKKTDGSIKEYTIKPRIEKVDGQDYRLFGISFITSYKKGIGQAFIYSIEGVVDTTTKVFETLAMLIKGEVSMDNLSGPVGMYSLVDSAKSSGLINILYLLQYLSVNVGIINLLPVPVFDGGLIFILIIEKIIKRKTSDKLKNTLNFVGFGLLVLLMLFVTYNDIIRLVVK